MEELGWACNWAEVHTWVVNIDVDIPIPWQSTEVEDHCWFGIHGCKCSIEICRCINARFWWSMMQTSSAFFINLNFQMVRIQIIRSVLFLYIATAVSFLYMINMCRTNSAFNSPLQYIQIFWRFCAPHPTPQMLLWSWNTNLFFVSTGSVVRLCMNFDMNFLSAVHHVYAFLTHLVVTFGRVLLGLL